MEDNLEREFIKTQLYTEECYTLLKQSNECIMKNVEDSRTFRNNGNKIYYKYCDNQQMEKIFELYTKSIAYALPNSEELVFAYGNRSALLHRMKKYEESISDIERALKISKCHAEYQIKLLCRKIECLASQNLPDAKQVYDQAESLLSKIVKQNNNNDNVYDKMKKAKEAVNKVNTSNFSKEIKVIPEHIKKLSEKETKGPFCSVSLQYTDDQFGRHLIATRDIKPGEILFVEKPYVNCLNPDYFYIYCGHCFKKSWASIPCDYCHWCMFCSEECKTTAWLNYHNIECFTVSYLKQHHKIDTYDHLSLRSLLMGLKESGSIAKFKTDLQPIDKWIDQYEKGIFKGEIFQNEGFKSIYTLCSKVSVSCLREYAADCAVILIILFKHTLLFGKYLKFENINDIFKNEDILFIGSVLLKLRKRSNLSAQTIHKVKPQCKFSNDTTTCKINKCCSRGVCIFPLTFFINHSCNPNANICITNDLKLVVFSQQHIKKDSQLYMGHDIPFYSIERSMRQGLIRQSMKFICDCNACKYNWPTLNQMYKMPKEKPFFYAKNYKKIESDLYDENNALVSSIFYGHSNIQYDQTVIRNLVKAMEKASKYLKQPSIVLCELMISLGIVFEKMYCSDSSC